MIALFVGLSALISVVIVGVLEERRRMHVRKLRDALARSAEREARMFEDLARADGQIVALARAQRRIAELEDQIRMMGGPFR